MKSKNESKGTIRTSRFGKEFLRCSDVDFEVALEIFRVPGYELGGVRFRVGSDQKVREYSFYSLSPLLQECGVDLSRSLGYFQASGKVGSILLEALWVDLSQRTISTLLFILPKTG